MKSPNGFLDAPNSRFEDPVIGEAGCADVQKLISRRVLLELGPRNESSRNVRSKLLRFKNFTSFERPFKQSLGDISV